jgi:hypothetical protein
LGGQRTGTGIGRTWKNMNVQQISDSHNGCSRASSGGGWVVIECLGRGDSPPRPVQSRGSSGVDHMTVSGIPSAARGCHPWHSAAVEGCCGSEKGSVPCGREPSWWGCAGGKGRLGWAKEGPTW